MSIEKVRAAFAAQGIADRIRELDESSATVALAAQALGCGPGRIAKTLSFQGKEQPILVVAADDGVMPQTVEAMAKSTITVSRSASA